jgi:hypothetical protein
MAKGRASEARRSVYSVHPGVVMTQKWILELPEKTGRSLEQWIAVVQNSGCTAEAERRGWLKSEHQLGTNAAWWITERAAGKGAEDSDPDAYLVAAERWVKAMYGGGKAALRPLHDRLLALGLALGEDVRICPCKTIVPLYRRHVFAQIKPTTQTRIDLGLALAKENRRLPRRLLDTGGSAKGDRITHRISLATLADIDDQVERWLRRAYDLDA